MKKVRANDQPNNPAENINSDGLVRGEATTKATSGAHGAVVAIIPSRTAVVPQEQKGVSVATSTAPPMAIVCFFLRKPATRSVPI